MTRWDKNAFLMAWRADSDRLREAAVADELDRDVPSCPGWSLRDLVAHVARVFLNYERLVTATAAPPADSKGDGDFDLGEDVLAEYDTAVRKLTTTLDGVRLDDPAWVPGPHARIARFWIRRLMCETAVHRWDAQMAFAAAEPIGSRAAAEGIQEVFDTFIPWGRRREESTATGVVQLFARDIDRHWFVRLREGRETLLDPDSVDVDNTAIQASASGNASDLYLALWGRVQTSVLELAGDETLFKALRVR